MIPTVQVQIEFVVGTWTDVTAYLQPLSTITITRGRENESTVATPGTCSFQLKNEDGRFTPGLTTGAYYPNVRRLKKVQITIRSRRFTGYVDIWTVPAGQKRGVCLVRCIDRSTLDGKHVLKALNAEALELRVPLKHWDLTIGKGDLVPKYSGAEGGTLDWGSGEVLPGDDAGGVKFTPAANETTGVLTGGWRLEGSMTLPSSYSVVICYGASTTGPMLRLGKVSIDIEGQDAIWKGATTSMKLDGQVEIISVNASGVILSSDPTRQVRTPPASTSTVRVGGLQGVWSGASVSHVAVVPYLNSAQMSALLAQLTRSPIAASAAIAFMLTLSQVGAATPGVRGSDTEVLMPPTTGQSAQSVIDTITIGALGRYTIDRNGLPQWVSFDYSPTTVAPPSTVGIMPETTWEPALGAWVTDVTTDLLDGSAYTYSDATGVDRPSVDVLAVMPTDGARRAVAAYIADYSSDDPRLNGLGFDLLPLSATTTDQILALDIGSRVTVSGLPSFIPPTPTVVVEGYTETYSQNSWVLQLNTSPAISTTWFAWGNAWGSRPWKPF